MLQFAFPIFLEDALKFKTECKVIFENFGENNARISFLREILTEPTMPFFTFYSHITSILALWWFKMNTSKNKKLFLDTRFSLLYNDSDAKQIRKLLDSNLENSLCRLFLDKCATIFLSKHRYENGIALFQQCKYFAKTDLEQGRLCQNIAIIYRSNKKFKLMLSSMQEALLRYKNSQSNYHICMALQLIAESRWKLGSKDLAMKTLQDMEKVGENLTENEKYLIPFRIGCSFDRLREKSYRNKYWVKSLKLLPDNMAERALQLCSYLNDEFVFDAI